MTAALPFGLGGCAGVLVVGGLAAAGGAGYEAAQERGISGSVDDFTLKTNVESAFLAENPNLQSGITVTVYNGRVLLTGRSPTPEWKATAKQLASRTPGVRAVYDEIELGQPVTTWDSTQDAWITTRVRSELVLDSEIRSSNYTIDTAYQSVYLIGSARSQSELERATRIAQYVPGVRRVVSYVEIRPGAPVASSQQPPLSSGPGPGPGVDRPAPAGPRAPIDVQRL